MSLRTTFNQINTEINTKEYTKVDIKSKFDKRLQACANSFNCMHDYWLNYWHTSGNKDKSGFMFWA